MKKLNLTLVVFCAAISVACCFMCYQCTREGEGEYTTEQCEKDQRIVNCTNRDPTDNEDYTCVRMYSKSEDGEEYETRACYIKSVCEEKKKECEDDDRLKEVKIKECTITCCVSDGDTPCNEGVTFSANIIMMMFAVLYSFKLF